MTKTDIERIARLEAELDHVTETMDKMAKKVDDVHELMLKARGAQWAFYGIAGLIGFATSKLGAFATWLPTLPR